MVRVWIAVALLLGCKPSDDAIARGRYLANLAGCAPCHASPAHEPDFGGGVEVAEPDGAWRGANITPHARTGIGAWTDAQIVAAIRDGVRPDGSRLHAIMPVRSYRVLTDRDAAAIVAYLRSLPAIDRAVPRIPHLGGAAAGRTDPVSDPGAYLVTVMHCAGCHATPDRDDQPFAGGKRMTPFGARFAVLGSGTLVASNITPDRETGIGRWTADDIARAIRTLARPDGTTIRGPMQLYLAGWSAIDDADLRAVARYLARLPAVAHRVPAATFVPHGPSSHGHR